MAFQVAVMAAAVAFSSVCLAQYYNQAPPQQYGNNYQPGYQNRSTPYGNYSAGGSMYGNYSQMPQYPPMGYNSTGARYQNNSYGAYNGKPFEWVWDHESQGRHAYDQEAQNWIYGNAQIAWDWAVGTWEQQNGVYSGYGATCGYTGNTYNTYEMRHSKHAELLVLMAQWLWDNYPGYNKQILIPAMTNINAYQLGIPAIQDCLAENYGQYQGTCDQYQRYSRPDQVCNNVGFPQWGAWLDIGIRISNYWNYQNGIWIPMQYNIWPGYDGTISPLIDAKVLANALDSNSAYNGECYNLDVTMLHAYFTQFIAHDIISSAYYTVTGYNGIQVKPECCQTPDNCLHHSCDSYRGQNMNGYNAYPYCEQYSANLPGLDYCTPLPKDPTNKQTAYIDGSQIYGASCYEAAKLRSFRKGKMRVNKGMYGLYAKNVLLPDDPSPDVDQCDISYPDGNLRCLLAGDARVNQHPGLVALHSLYLRLHNRVASSCAKWQEKYYISDDIVDEICYQETRRIIQAIIQNIFYRDHLPIELGPYLTSNPNYGLGLDYVLPYDAAVHASVWPEYAHAAGRLHSIVSHWSQVVDPAKMNYQEPDNWYGIYDWFKKGYALMYSKHKLNELMSNSLYDPEQCYDTDFVPELRNVNPQYGGHGIDMLWTNLKRGREFGMPWYTQVREFCGMGYLDDFSQLQGVWSQHCLNTVPNLVYHVKNVEAYVGMICEKPLPGAIVGPTAACILQRQYYNLREGDRWFFDRNGFTYDQLAVVKKFNLGKILCITTNLDYVSENVFRTPNSYTNKYQSCNAYDDITEDDLSVLWSTIPYAVADYRTCKEYGGYNSAGYQNATYQAPQQYQQNNSYAAPYQQAQPAYQQPAAYQAPQQYQKQNNSYAAPAYQPQAAYGG